MQPANYFLASFLSWLGLIAGVILMKIAPEEKKPMSHVFEHVSKISLLLIFIFTAYYFYSKLISIAVIILFFILILLIEKRKNTEKFLMVQYSILGFIFWMSLENSNLLILNSSLIFIFGASKGSSLFNPRKNSLSFLLYSVSFLLIANLMFLIK